MNRILLALTILLIQAKTTIAFLVTFPDSPVVIAELPPSITNNDRDVARTLVRDSRNNLYAVYSRTDSIMVSRSTDNGASWHRFGAPGWKILWNEPGLRSPCIAIDRGDSLYVAWQRKYPDSLRGGVSTVYWSKYNGKRWTEQETLTNDILVDNWYVQPSLAVDAQNKVHATWSGGLDLFGHYTICYSYLRPEGVWNWPMEDIGEHPTYSIQPNLVADEFGNLHLGYTYYLTGIIFFARYRKWSNGVWGPIEDLSIHPFDSSYGSTSITIVPGQEKPHATFAEDAWQHAPGHFHYYYRNKPDSNWSQPAEIIQTNWGSSFSPPILTADREGHLYFAYKWTQTLHGGNVVAMNIWMRDQRQPPGWSVPYKVSNDTIPVGSPWGYYNQYPDLGYPVTENGVDVTWIRTYSDISGVRPYLMYHRLPSLLGVEQEKEKAPSQEPELTLTPRPNPARGQIEIAYGIPKQEMVSLTVYNFLGERVRTLVHGPTPAGVYRARWNGKDERLKEAPSGTYFFQLTVGSKQVIKKGTFIR